MQYSEKDLPVRLHDGEMLVLDDGNEVRWESNGEAKAVFIGSSFDATMELFPNQKKAARNLLVQPFPCPDGSAPLKRRVKGVAYENHLPGAKGLRAIKRFNKTFPVEQFDEKLIRVGKGVKIRFVDGA